MNSHDMPDVQSSHDARDIAIDQVGIKAIRHPMTFLDEDREHATVAECQLTVGLPADKKGTHMSRFVALLNDGPLTLSIVGLADWTRAMIERLEAQSGEAHFTFPYFIAKEAPVSGQGAMMDYDVTLIGRVEHGRAHIDLKLVIPVTSLCPCSKEISAYGAHNQRSHITVETEISDPTLSLRELIAAVETQGSCPLWGLLKRPDEKWITEYAFDNPKFVEDMVRDVANALEGYPGLNGFSISVENFESIHNHSAWAVIHRPGR
ncbi:MAG: GTP cyclohydrolase FolE2 [Guyparkeria sp.]|uniref:GTP cyclohydrolase FolE2 n=1 Tax=Guyparkeria sp. TaxID=2035736 RepID=UPI003979B683